MEKPVILRADHLKKHFAVTQGLLMMKVVGWVKAVDDISFSIRQGETLALGRGVGLWQDDHGQAHPAAGTSDCRPGLHRRQRCPCPRRQ